MQPKMWGTSIVGYGNYHYKYASGHEGDSCLTGFSSRKAAITVYVMGDFTGKSELITKLGMHKMGKGCIYIKKLSDVDPKVLEQIVAGTVAELKRRYG